MSTPADTPAARQALEALRSEIDAIDDEIIALIHKRSGVVQKVADLKSREMKGKHNLRPGREASMVRRVVEQFKETPFSAAAAAAIWRLIIGASTSIETTLKVCVFAPEGNSSYLWLAREYFGSFIPMQRQPVVSRVIGDIIDGKASIGIVPLPNAEDSELWWRAMASPAENQPRIFARIPFIQSLSPTEPVALAIGRVEPEETGHDRTYLLITATEDLSTSRLQELMKKYGMPGNWVYSQPQDNIRRHLVTVDLFLNDDDARIKKLMDETHGALIRVASLGSYAIPIQLKDKNRETASKTSHG